MENINVQINVDTLRDINIKYSRKGFNINNIPFNNFTLEITRNEEQQQDQYNKLFENMQKAYPNLSNNDIDKHIKNISVLGNTIVKYKIQDNKLTIQENNLISKINLLSKDLKESTQIGILNFIDINTIKFYDNKNNILDLDSNLDIILEEVFRNIASLNGIYNYILDDKKEKVISNNRVKKESKKGKSKKSNKKVTYINKVRYVCTNNAITSTKKGYNLSCEPFVVHGHWRTYRNGKKVWIKSFTKCKNDNMEINKKYKIK